MDQYFMHPEVLYLLVPLLPALAAVLIGGFKLREVQRNRYGSRKLIDSFSERLTLSSELPIFAGWLTVFILLVVALAQPIGSVENETVDEGTLDVVVAIDTSLSMNAEAYRQNMPDKEGVPAKRVKGRYGTCIDMVNQMLLKKVMPVMRGNRMGIVLYAAVPFSQAELTDDYSALTWVIEHWVKVGAVPGRNSDLGAGLQEALATFKRSDDLSRTKTIILFSDGGSTGDPKVLADAIEKIKSQHIKLVVVGVGPSVLMPIPEYSYANELTGYYKVDGKDALTVIDENMLYQIAQATDGTYMRVSDSSPLDVVAANWAHALSYAKDRSSHAGHIYHLPLALGLLLMAALTLRGCDIRAWIRKVLAYTTVR